MGACSSSEEHLSTSENDEEKKKDAAISASIKKEVNEASQVLKLLLLGPGQSGKSTLFKQMIQHYGKGFSEHDRGEYAKIIFNYVILSAKTLIYGSRQLNIPLIKEVEPSARYILEEVKETQPIDKNFVKYLKTIWADEGIQRVYQLRTKFHLDDAVSYFFGRLDALAEEDYIPTYNDVLRVRAKTTGIIEYELTIESYHFKILDVGGQRSERRKWMNCFENVSLLLFVVAMSEYDALMYEDNQTNRMQDSLNLFNEVCNSRWFVKKSIALFLNKDDLFREKIKTTDLNICFRDYEGGKNYENALQFIKKAFLEKNAVQGKQIYVHVTCATDPSNFTYTFNIVTDTLIKEKLKESGFV